jgi:hypothetical protein
MGRVRTMIFDSKPDPIRKTRPKAQKPDQPEKPDPTRQTRGTSQVCAVQNDQRPDLDPTRRLNRSISLRMWMIRIRFSCGCGVGYGFAKIRLI